MSKKQINQLTEGSITNNSDVFMIDTYEGVTVKIPYSVLVSALFQISLVQGDNITITDATEDGIKKYRISSTATNSSQWYFGSSQPQSPNENDYWLRTDTGYYGDVYQYDGTDWNEVGTFAGRDGTDGTTPHIDATTKHWIIGETDTGVVAEGQDGVQGQQGIAGNDGASISFAVSEISAGHSVTISSTDASVEDRTFNILNGNDGDSISVTSTVITGGHRITITHTDTSKADQIFDVMDGTEIIQTTSDNRQVTLLSADWVGDSAPYTQTVTYSGMTASVVPEIGVVISDIVETGLEQQKQWGNITRAVSGANSITFYCYKDKPTIDLIANVKAV